ncbi:MAG: arsenate reductase ArsC [Pirellulaceae bacterium]
MPSSQPKTVLILCTGNACRSPMAEVLWNDLGRGTWQAQSAGSRPAGFVHEMAVRALQELNLPTELLVSKSWSQFEDLPLDLVVTLSDHARDSCPAWSEARQTLHWPFPDPYYAEGNEEERMAAFREVRDQMRQKIQSFLVSQD